MEKYQIKRLGKLLLCSSATFLLCQSTLAYSQEANPLTQELLHLKNKQQFENVNENLKKSAAIFRRSTIEYRKNILFS
nr:hemolysin activation/secretion protein-1 [Pasteurella multocida]